MKQLFYVLVLFPCFFLCKFAAQPSKPRVLTVAIEKPEIRNYDDDDYDDDDVDDGKDDEDDTQDEDDNDDGFVHEDIDDDDDSD